MSDVTRRLDDLSSAQKRDMLVRLLTRRDGQGHGSELSLDQQRLWFLRRMEPHVPTHVSAAYAVDGPLDRDRLQQALNGLLGRHDVLRTNFVELEGWVLPVRRTAVWQPLQVVDLSHLGGERADEETGGIFRQDARRPFDLADDPLVRTTLVRCARERHVLLITMHQMIADEFSLDLVIQELALRYNADPGGRPPSGHPPQFSAVVDEERAWLADRDAGVGRDLDYWRTQLADVPVLQLPTDRPRPAVKISATRAARCTTHLDAAVLDRLRRIASAEGIPLFAPLLAGFQALLGRYARQVDLAVGWPRSQRGPEAAALPGPRTNMLPLRADLTARPTFRDLVRRAGQSIAGALAHQRVPFERMVQELGAERALAHSPVFQVVCSMSEPHDRGGIRSKGSALRWTALDLDPGIALFDLALRLREERGGLGVRAEYSVELWEAQTITRLLTHLITLWTAAAADPGAQVGRVQLLTEAERAVIVEEWNRTPALPPADDCIHELVEAQARRTPDRVALVCGGVRMTYHQLDERANRLAHHLQSLGVVPETLVAVAADRSAATVVAILAVLKAGGAYLPFDPATPVRRLRYMLRHAGVEVLLARPSAMPAAAGVVVDVDDTTTWSVRMPASVPERHAGANHLAYCIYTSGSTGQPKGVLITHRQIVWSTRARSAVFPRPVDGYLMLAPLFFDASCAGLYWTLAEGGTLVMPTDAQIDDPAILGRLVATEHVSHLDGVPSQYAVLIETQGRAMAGVRCCLLAGEELTPALAAQHHRVAPGTALFNEYGATEVTVWATVHACRAEDAGSSVPVGRPIRGARLYLLDAEGQPVPVGVPGEVHIAGPGVARGYVGRPAETAERFVPDPFGPAGTRLYKIGDLARYRTDGSIEFVGRVDDQVKIRGFRVEPREVESVLASHDDLAGAAVVVRHLRTGDVQLIAYVVPRDGVEVAREALLGFLRDRLPDYMIPSQFVALDELPLTPQGKIDRHALPEPGAHAALPTSAPRTPLEKGVAAIFAEVLGLDHVGVHDDFFEIGGNSLHLARVGSRLSAAYDIDIPIHQFFSVPTVSGVSAMLELYRRKGQEGVLATRDPVAVTAEAVLDDSISPEGLPLANVTDPAGILLTGATGYLGVFLLQQLLLDTSADIYCLVRADDPDHGLRRIRRTAERFKLDLDPSFATRVRPVPGDLARPRFGLTAEEFAHLAAQTDAILHNGALVNFSFPYSRLKPPNVLGTQEVLRLACTTRVKAVHHISTMDVLIGSHTPRPFLEVDLPEQPLRVPFSYPESKWVAEKLVAIARARGVPSVIYRPGMMMGHTRTGACHETDYLLVGLRGFLRMGILPEFPEIMNSVTVDYAARAIVHILRQEASHGKVFHVWNLHAVPTMRTYDWVRSFGYEFDVEPYDMALERAMRLEPDHPLYPLLPVLFLYRSGDAGTHMTWEIHKTIDPRSECANTLAALGDIADDAAPLTEVWMHDLLAFLIAAGHLEPVERMRTGLDGP